MISKLIGRSAALLTVAFFMAISSLANGQTVTKLSANSVKQILISNDAGLLRSHLIDKLKGKINAGATGERFTVSGNGRSITTELVSQTVTIGKEKVEQISFIYKESGVTKTIDFVQFANGDLGKLKGNKLVTYSLASNRQACLDALFGPGSNCAACRTKVNNCISSSNRILKVLGCLLRSMDGACINCGIEYYMVVGCIVG